MATKGVKLTLVCYVTQNDVIGLNDQILGRELAPDILDEIITKKRCISYDNDPLQMIDCADKNSNDAAVIIVGKNAYLTRAYDNYKCVVVSKTLRQHSDDNKPLKIVDSLDAAIDYCSNITDHVYIVGGYSIFKECFCRSLCDEIILARLDFELRITDYTPKLLTIYRLPFFPARSYKKLGELDVNNDRCRLEVYKEEQFRGFSTMDIKTHNSTGSVYETRCRTCGTVDPVVKRGFFNITQQPG